MDGDWCVFGQQAFFDDWAEAEDHSSWVAAGVGYVLCVLDFFALVGRHFGKPECPFIVYAVSR